MPKMNYQATKTVNKNPLNS